MPPSKHPPSRKLHQKAAKPQNSATTSNPISTPPMITTPSPLNSSKTLPYSSKTFSKTSAIQVDTSVPTIDELRKIILSLKNGKVASDLPPELLKYAAYSDEFLNEVYVVMAEIWMNRRLPTRYFEIVEADLKVEAPSSQASSC